MPHWSSLVATALIVALGVIAAATDLKTGKVYNRHTYAFALTGLAFWSVVGFFCAKGGGGLPGAWEGFSHACLGLIAGFLPCMVLHFVFGLGMGDAKCFGAMGALLASWEGVMAMAVYGLLFGVATSLVILARNGHLSGFFRNCYLIFVQAAAIRRPQVPSVHLVPFCLPLALGAVLAAVEQLLRVRLPWSHLSPHAQAWLEGAAWTIR